MTTPTMIPTRATAPTDMPIIAPVLKPLLLDVAHIPFTQILVGQSFALVQAPKAFDYHWQ